MNECIKTAVTVLVTLLGSAGFWTWVNARTSKKCANTRLMVGLAHDRIVDLGMNEIIEELVRSYLKNSGDVK